MRRLTFLLGYFGLDGSEGGENELFRSSSKPLLFGDGRRETRERISTILFFIGYGIWLVWKLISVSMFSFSEGAVENTVLHLVSLALLALSSLVTLRLDGAFVLAVLTGLLGVAVFAATGDVVFVDLAVILYAGGITLFKKTATFSLAILFIGSAAIVVSSQIGIIPDYLFPRDGVMSRHGLGFLYCTNLSHLYLGMVLIYLYLRKERAQAIECLAILLIDGAIYYLTDSKNSCGLVLVAVVLFLMVRYFQYGRLCKVLCFLSRWAFVGFTVMSLIFALAYDSGSETWRTFNRITSNRIAQDNASLMKYGVRSFGQEIEFANRTIAMGETDKIEWETQPSGDRNIVESSFLNILITKGVVSLAAVLLLFWVALRRNTDGLIATIMLVIAAHSAFDFQLINLLYTTFLFYVWNRCANELEEMMGHGMRMDRSRWGCSHEN